MKPHRLRYTSPLGPPRRARLSGAAIPVPRVPAAPLRPLVAHMTMREIASLAGVQRRTLHKYFAAGQIPEHRAEAIACGLGLHPMNIWPDEWEALGAP